MLNSNIKQEAVDILEAALLITKELDFMSDDKPMFTIAEMEIIICLCSNNFFEDGLLFDLYYYISRLEDKNIIKLRFYDKVLIEIINHYYQSIENNYCPHVFS